MDSGLEFDFSYAPGTTWEQAIAFEMAGELWSEYLSDNMTVNIHVEMTSELPDNVIGGALPAMVTDISYNKFRDAYEADITSWRDGQSFDGLPLTYEKGKEKFEARIDLGANSYVEDSNDLDLTRANAKALGLVNPNSKDLDGYILMNDLSGVGVSWSHNRYWRNNSQLDYFSVAVHEVGHILGFVSGVDKSEGLFFDSQNNLLSHFNYSQSNINSYLDRVIDRASPLDLFRYSWASKALNNNSSNTIDLSVGGESFFSQNGVTYHDPFATGKNTSAGGDGFQASHWRTNYYESDVTGIMDPVLKTGARRTVSNRDLLAMDAIGYDVTRTGNNLMDRANQSNGWRVADTSDALMSRLDYQAKNNVAKDRYNWAQGYHIHNWMGQNPNLSSDMVDDRDKDVQKMISKSKVYEGRGSKGSKRGRNLNRQEFWQDAYFCEFSWQELAVESNASVVDVAYIILQADALAMKSDFESTDNSNSLEISDRDLLAVTNTEMSLLSLAPSQSIALSSELETELMAEGSLYRELADAELVMALA